MSLIYKEFGGIEYPVFILKPHDSKYTIGFAAQFSEIGRGFAIYMYVHEGEYVWAASEAGAYNHDGLPLTSDLTELGQILFVNKELYDLLIRNVDIIHRVEQDYVLFTENIFFIKELDFEAYIFPHMRQLEVKSDQNNDEQSNL